MPYNVRGFAQMLSRLSCLAAALTLFPMAPGLMPNIDKKLRIFTLTQQLREADVG
jgi:hypothetical protein